MFKRIKQHVIPIFVIGALLFGVILPALAGDAIGTIWGQGSSGPEMFKKKQIIVYNITQTNSTTNTTIPIDSNGTVYTHSFPISDADYFAFGYKLAGNNTTVQIQLQQSTTAPSTEGSADTTYVVPTGQPDVESALVNSTIQYYKAYSPVSLSYGRLKVIGSAGSNTTMTATVSTQNSL